MYLSQPCDWMPPMSAGYSRDTTHVAHSEHLAQLVTRETGRYLSDRYETDSTGTSASPSWGYRSHRRQTVSASQADDAYAQGERAYKPSVHVVPDSLAMAMSNSEGRSQSRWFRSRHFEKVWEQLDAGNSETRPPHPYTELIKLCILKRREGKLTLNQLYRDLEDKFPFFAASERGKGWKNTLRHNLSTQPYFIKLEREHGQLGKGHYWAYCPDLEKPTSLAQSSVVQLSSLWPPSVSAASIPLRDVSTRKQCSTTKIQHASKTLNTDTTPPSLPWYETQDTMHGLRELPRNYTDLQAEVEQTAPKASSSRFPPGPACNRGFSTDYDAKHHPTPVRMRTAPVCSPSRPASHNIQTTPPKRDRDTSRPSALWPASSSTVGTSESSSKEYVSGSGSALADLPRIAARKSLGDYYLSHPISSTRKSPNSCPAAPLVEARCPTAQSRSLY